MRKKTIRSYVKNLNKEVLKLSWLFLIVMSLLLLVFLQLYRNTTNDQNGARQNQVDSAIDSLEQRIQNQDKRLLEQQQVIEALQKEMQKIKGE